MKSNDELIRTINLFLKQLEETGYSLDRFYKLWMNKQTKVYVYEVY